jgi:hypothetical protein
MRRRQRLRHSFYEARRQPRAYRGADTLSLRSGIDIVVKPASYRSVRGPTCIGCICDEIAFWHDQDSSSNPAKEILRALLPSLLTTNGPLVAISSPYSRQGPLYENHHRHYGKDDSRVLVVQAGTLTMHPGVSQELRGAKELSCYSS